MNETKIGEKQEDGTIVSQGFYGDVYSFEILAEYANIAVSYPPNTTRLSSLLNVV